MRRSTRRAPRSSRATVCSRRRATACLYRRASGGAPREERRRRDAAVGAAGGATFPPSPRAAGWYELALQLREVELRRELGRREVRGCIPPPALPPCFRLASTSALVCSLASSSLTLSSSPSPPHPLLLTLSSHSLSTLPASESFELRCVASNTPVTPAADETGTGRKTTSSKAPRPTLSSETRPVRLSTACGLPRPFAGRTRARGERPGRALRRSRRAD